MSISVSILLDADVGVICLAEVAERRCLDVYK